MITTRATTTTRQWLMLILFSITLFSVGSAQKPLLLDPCSGKDDAVPVTLTVDTTGLKDAVPPPNMVPVERQPVPMVYPSRLVLPPQLAQRYGMRYKAWVKFWISKTGSVRQIVVKECVPAEVRPYLVNFAKQCTFDPAWINDAPVEVYMTMPVVY